MYYKYIPRVAVPVTLALLLAACGNSNTNNTVDNTNTKTAVASSTSPDVSGTASNSTGNAQLASALPVETGFLEKDRTMLIQTAKLQLEREWTRSPPLCSKVKNERVGTTTFGTITKTTQTGELAEPLPAIVVGFDYTCINGYTATKSEEQHWMTMAIDEDFDMIRCMYVWGGKEQAYGTADGCGFVEAE